MIFPLPQGAFKKRSEGLGKAGSMCTIIFYFVLHSQQSMRPGQAMSILLVILYFLPHCFFNAGCILFNKISELVDIGGGQSDCLGWGSSPEVRSKVRNCKIRLMAHGTDHRIVAVAARSGYNFFIKRPQVLQ